jgi:hypothetical protein
VGCLNSDKLSVAKQRLADCFKEENRKAGSMDNTAVGKLKFGDHPSMNLNPFETCLEYDSSVESYA